MKYSILILLLSATIATAKPLKVGDRDSDGALIVAVGNAPSGQVSSTAVCPKCGKVHAPQQQATGTSAAQAHAQREANLMARLGRMGHLLGVAPGARFSGVGYGPTPNCNTCTPRRRMTLVADAVARGRNGYYYRSRHWR